MITKRDLIIAVLLTFCLAVALFQILPISSQSASDYDPWYDVNDDGTIDMRDIGGVAIKFGSSGTNITKASVEYDSDWIDISDKAGQYFNVTHNLNSTEIMVDIQGKRTMGGGIHQKYLGGSDHVNGWEKTYGENQTFSAIAPTNDGGYILAGGKRNGEYEDFWLMKTDASGNMEWNRTYVYSATQLDSATSVLQANDGGYAVYGLGLNISGAVDAWLVKTDASGNMEWNKTYGYSDEWTGRMIQTNDGGYALAASTNVYGVDPPYDSEAYLVKTDSNGNLEWNQTYDLFPYGVITWSVAQTMDGGYVLAGEYSNYTSGDRGNAVLFKTDSNGNLQWNKTYGGVNYDNAYDVVCTSDGGYALAGHTASFGTGGDYWLIKTDALGNEQWNKTYANGGPDGDYCWCLIQTSDGGYALCGTYDSYGAYKIWIVKTDTFGFEQWSKTYEGFTWGFSMIQTSDGGYAISGHLQWHGLFIKTDITGNTENFYYGLGWVDSTQNTITLYRGIHDTDWNYIRVRIWKIRE